LVSIKNLFPKSVEQPTALEQYITASSDENDDGWGVVHVHTETVMVIKMMGAFT
jgi:predicted glutamine amidotransferase